MDLQIKVKCYIFKKVSKQINPRHPESKKKRENKIKKWHYNITMQRQETEGCPFLLMEGLKRREKKWRPTLKQRLSMFMIINST